MTEPEATLTAAPRAMKPSRGVDFTYGGYLFLLPNFVGFMAFVFLPIIASLVLSFCSWQALKEPWPQWVGFANFAKLLTERTFWYYTFNTVFMMLGIPVGMALSLVLALLLNRGVRFIRVYRMVYFLPTISAGVALLILWVWIYDATYGLLNYTLARVGVEGPNWLGGGFDLAAHWPWLDAVLQKIGIKFMFFWSKPALMLMGLWTGVGGYNMLLYLAGLQGINPELYEAADVDGANAWQKFRHITWPMLTPTTFFIFTMSLIGGFQGGFQAAYVMTQGGGPEGSSTTISYEIFHQLFVADRVGYASAIAWFLFLVVFALTMLNWHFGGKVVHYE